MKGVLERLRIQEWFDSSFGARPAARFELVLGLLNGGGNYGPALRYSEDREVYYSIIGCWNFDKRGLPVFNGSRPRRSGRAGGDEDASSTLGGGRVAGAGLRVMSLTKLLSAQLPEIAE